MELLMKCKLSVFLLMYGLLYGQSSIGQDRHNPAAHTHGLASMTVVYDAGQLQIEVETPAANLLGFEHEPQNAQQWQQLEQIKKSLKKPATAIGLTSDCVIHSIDVDMPFSEAAHDNHDDDHHAHHDDHDDHDKHDQDKHAHHDEADAHDMHKDIRLNYVWHCDDVQPKSITVNLFQHFTGFEKIEAQWIVAGKQGANMLTQSQPVLKVAP